MTATLTQYMDLIKSLPPLMAVLVWDVVNNHVTAETVALANQTSKEEFQTYDLVRMLAAGNPNYGKFLAEDGKVLVDDMVEEMVTP